ncbi:MAG: hypothetical protein JJ974_11840, partial [Phycisphaerales bacterium]|nr:hypothetical protein [Phycisphaerales bacterium]
MPALSKIHTPALETLAAELSFAGKPTLLRHLSRIEQLAPLIEQDGLYPQDFIVFRITNYRPDIENPELIPAADLLSDLSALAEHLSSAAKLTPQDLPADHLSIDELAQRWSVSRKTIERYRRLGLVARRIDKGSGHHAIAFLQGPVEWFEQHHAKRLKSAAQFSRMDEALTKKIINDARRYKRRLNLNRSHTAQRIAQRIGRSSESVRRTLIAYDDSCAQTSNQPIFSMPLPPTEQQQRTMLVQSLQGKRTGTIAALHHRSTTAVSRSINRARAALIKDIGLQPAHELPADYNQSDPLDHPSLSTPITTTNLVTSAPHSLNDFLANLRDPTPPVLHEHTTRATAITILEHHAVELSKTLHPSTPSGATLDQIETNLRWIVLLKNTLIETQLPLMLSTIEQHIGGPIDTLDPTRATQILQDAVATVAAAITTSLHRHVPTATSRLAAPVSLAITRWSTRLPDIATPPTQGQAAPPKQQKNPPPHRPPP